MKKQLKLISCFLISISMIFLTIYTPSNAATKYYKMYVNYIDVGESDCVLIQSNGHSMLIDAGNNGDGDDIVDYLESLKVTKLDYIICSHPHADHLGGMDDVIEAFDIGKVIMPNVTHTTKTFEDVLDAIDEKGLKITKPVVGKEYTIGKAEFTVIAPNEKYKDLNNNSVGIKLTNGENSFVFIGDCEKEAISDILDNGIDVNADVLMLGHHGSDTSTTAGWLDAVSPSSAIISVGKNSYGHPSDDVLGMLQADKIKTYCTDENGTIVAISTGTKITFDAVSYNYTIVTSTPKPTPKIVITPKPTIKPIPTVTAAPMVTVTPAPTVTPMLVSPTHTITVVNEDNIMVTVYITASGTKYHKDGCSYLSKSKIAISLKDAKAQGYEPCSRCNPPE